MSWRETARPIIARVLKENCGKSEAEIRKALHDAYPFGMRQYHPYKQWLDEIRLQRGTQKPKGYTKAQLKLAEWEKIYGKAEQLKFSDQAEDIIIP